MKTCFYTLYFRCPISTTQPVFLSQTGAEINNNSHQHNHQNKHQQNHRIILKSLPNVFGRLESVNKFSTVI